MTTLLGKRSLWLLVVLAFLCQAVGADYEIRAEEANSVRFSDSTSTWLSTVSRSGPSSRGRRQQMAFRQKARRSSSMA